MENRIQVLPEDTVNKIAAGEVVESPASVVKELMENSLDAGAKRITVVVTKGGKEVIKVVDDGIGMSPQDARLAMRRHATSKIRNLDDLISVKSMGFRGEALPSIASVSEFTMISRQTGTNEGVKIDFSDGKMRVEPAAHPQGTSITVKNLFFNVPARKKFLKSDRYEGSRIQQVVIRYAFARLDCHFLFYKDDRKVYDLPPVNTVSARVVQVFGTKMAQSVYSIDSQGSLTHVWGCISDPVLVRSQSDRMLIYVNQRPVLDKGLRRAVLSAYGPLVPSGRFPTAVVHIDMPPELVDVNCHPQKTEVRFAGPARVFEAVFHAVREVVEKTPWIKYGGGIMPEPVSVPAETERPPDSFTEEPRGIHRDSMPIHREPGLFDAPMHYQSDPDIQEKPQVFERFTDLRYIGQMGRVILVFEAPSGKHMVLIDQHAAHEKVNYERLKKQVASGKPAVLPLLFPQSLHLSPDDVRRFEAIQGNLRQAGFEVEISGDDNLVLKAVPQILGNRDPMGVIKEMLGEHRFGRKDLDLIIATTACHASIRAGDKVDAGDVQALIRAMDETATSSYCPHGRQAVVTLPMEKVLRWFGR